MDEHPHAFDHTEPESKPRWPGELDVLRATVEALAEGVVLHDREGVIRFWNAATERILGLTADQLAGRTSYHPQWRLIDEQGSPMRGDQHPTSIVMATGQPVTRVLGVHVPDGRLTWLRVHAIPVQRARDGAIAGAVAMFSDITAERSATAKARQMEEQVRVLAETTRDLVCLHAPDGRYRYVTPSVHPLLGYAPEELVGADPYDFFHPDDRQRIRDESHARALEGDPTGVATVYRFRHKDGRWVWLETLARPVLDSRGEVLGITTSSRDITERRALEGQLRQVAKLEGIGQLAGGVAHDFNNILTVISGGAETLARETMSPGARIEVQAISEAAARAQALTGKLLTFARRQVEQPRVMPIDAVVERAEPLLRRLLRAGHRLQVDLDARDRAATVDAHELELALLNLVANAREAMPDGGTITIRTGAVVVAADDPGRAPGMRAGGWLRVSVADAGVGLSDEVRAHLFEPFFTTKPVGQGTGLGLASVFGIAQRAGGTVTYESTLGQGTTFHLWIPEVLGPAGAAPARRTTPQEALRAQVATTVLVVDDEEDVRRLTVRVLVRAGFEVLEATGADDALALLQSHRGRVQVLLTDYTMPGASGAELIERAVALRPGLATILVSGYAADVVVRDNLRDSGTRFLAKPYSLRELTELVSELASGGAE